MIQLKDKRVLVTGSNGFLGRHLCHLLLGLDVKLYNVWDSSSCDLTSERQIRQEFPCELDYVFHLAGHNGGIQFNLDYPFDIFEANTKMAINVMRAAFERGAKKVVSVVASCAYGQFCGWQKQEIMSEENFLYDTPHPSVACHGYAKRNLQLASFYAKQQYGLNAVCACPTTLYGPGDSYDPKRTKVLGGMIKRFVDAKDNGDRQVTCWGTGAPLREFLYVEDCAKLLVETMLHYDDSEYPLNLGTGQEYSIKEVAEKVAKGVLYDGDINWDASRPDGQYRKRLDLTRMKQHLPHFEATPFEAGLAATIQDYRNYKQSVGTT